jgi:hypothetical protein
MVVNADCLLAAQMLRSAMSKMFHGEPTPKVAVFIETSPIIKTSLQPGFPAFEQLRRLVGQGTLIATSMLARTLHSASVEVGNVIDDPHRDLLEATARRFKRKVIEGSPMSSHCMMNPALSGLPPQVANSLLKNIQEKLWAFQASESRILKFLEDRQNENSRHPSLTTQVDLVYGINEDFMGFEKAGTELNKFFVDIFDKLDGFALNLNSVRNFDHAIPFCNIIQACEEALLHLKISISNLKEELVHLPHISSR